HVLLLGPRADVVDGLGDQREEAALVWRGAGGHRPGPLGRLAEGQAGERRDTWGRPVSGALGGVLRTVGQRLVHAAVLADQQDEERRTELDQLGPGDAVLGGTRR